MTTLLTNSHIYRAIAEEAYAEAKRFEEEAKTPKPDGRPGYVIALDPSRKSYKQSLIAIAFAGVYLEAILFFKGTQRMGKRWGKVFDRKTYEEKLMELGATDQSLIQATKRLRTVRKELVHEKALPVGDLTLGSTYWAQSEAASAIECIRKASLALQNAV